ncbi:protein-arginine deiminase family protein [Actinomyces vulturis]|uniref:protein-arginine deiminase family protein n=1 Tax=Actinomyces vulturis TaxID=1857645 RepID=UPI00082E2294|nr:protein-arginine deiminase family protein [Actinomyces vulturis]
MFNFLSAPQDSPVPPYCVPNLSNTGTATQIIAIIVLLLLTVGVGLVALHRSKKSAIGLGLALALIGVGFAPVTDARANAAKQCPEGYHYVASLDPDSKATKPSSQDAAKPAPSQPETKTPKPSEPTPTQPTSAPEPSDPANPGQPGDGDNGTTPGVPAPKPLNSTVVLVADTNRDGVADPISGADTETAPATIESGAVFLANLDDSAQACPMTNNEGQPLELEDLRTCYDAADDVVNGDADLADMAPLASAPMPNLSDSAAGTVTVDANSKSKVRIFIERNGEWTALNEQGTVTATELKAGLNLRLEGTDVVKDNQWNGTVTVTLTVTDGDAAGSSVATLRQAPLLTQNHLQTAETLLTLTQNSGYFSGQLATNLKQIAEKNGFETQLFGASREVWVQDSFEPMYQAMPSTDGIHMMRVMLKTDQVRGVFSDPAFPDQAPDATDKTSIYQALYGLRGAGVAVLDIGQQQSAYTLDSAGNIEALPPMPGYPAGRVLLGYRTPDNIPEDADEEEPHKPSQTISDFFTYQGAQDPIYLDTSFLSVGHIDEMITTIPADTELGWKLVVSSPEAGLNIYKKLQAEGHGGEQLMSHDGAVGTTIDIALADGNADWVNLNAERIINSNIEVLKNELGITDADIIRVPVFYRAEIDDDDPNGVDLSAKTYAADFVPNAVNGVVINKNTYLAPMQFGPVIEGKDLFKEAVDAAFAQAGMNVIYVDTYRTLYVHGGELHCGTNMLRTPVAYYLK